jgi:hypothetical protein
MELREILPVNCPNALVIGGISNRWVAQILLSICFQPEYYVLESSVNQYVRV